MRLPYRSWRERPSDTKNAEHFGPPLCWSDEIHDPNIEMRRVTAAMLGMDPDAPDDEPRGPTEEEIDGWLMSMMDDDGAAE